eukprot:3296902-Prymnesium_polylepis.1
MRVSCGRRRGWTRTWMMNGLVGGKAGEADGLTDRTELSVCGGAACGQDRGRQGGERLTLLGCS